MKNLILLFLLFTATFTFAQTTLSQNEKGDVVQTETNLITLPSTIVKCYQEKDIWYCITETKTVVSKEEIEKQMVKDEEITKEIAERKSLFLKLKTKN